MLPKLDISRSAIIVRAGSTFPLAHLGVTGGGLPAPALHDGLGQCASWPATDDSLGQAWGFVPPSLWGRMFAIRWAFSALICQEIARKRERPLVTSYPTIGYNGGGGNRTPVPRRLRKRFYVRSRSFASRVGERRPTGFGLPQPDFCFARVRSDITHRLAH